MLTVHTALQAMLTQLVFRWDVIFNILFESYWQLIQKCKQALIKKDNAHKNARQISHAYNVGDKVLVTMDMLDKYSTTLYKGPYKIMKANNNGTIKFKWVQC